MLPDTEIMQLVYELETTNNGTIEAGFLGSQQENVTIGNIAVPTERFCKFVGSIATGVVHQFIPTTHGKEIVGSFDDTYGLIKINNYQIAAETFGKFADHIFAGGYIGWDINNPNWRLDYVNETLDYVQKHMNRASRNGYLTLSKQKSFENLEERVEAEK